MCIVCERVDAEVGAANVGAPHGAVAQLAEHIHGMDGVARSIRVSSTCEAGPAPTERGLFFGGLIAAEGWFSVTRATPPRLDGSIPLKFVFGVTMADRDRALLTELVALIGFGSVSDAPPKRPGWQATSILRVSSRKAHVASTIPFLDGVLLPPTHKRVQYEQWKSALLAYEVERPRRTGRSMCSEDGCERPVRGRGLCRSHYYRATGY